MNVENIKTMADQIRENISKVIIGKDETIDMVLMALFTQGHVLLEDVPGLGKTVLAKTLSKSISCDFKRIQFTPDLLPSDCTGLSIYNQKEGTFNFQEGPLFTNIVLADEINRATPRTQSALLECMEERQITVEGVTRQLERPFFVIATQNPLETQGTFPLPEAQMDRFFVKLSMGYPTKEDGINILKRFESDQPYDTLESVVTKNDIVEVQDALTKIKVSDLLKGYIMDLVEATRNSQDLVLGVSPRGALALMRGARAYAAIKGRDYVTPSDVKKICVPIMAHRVMLKGHSLSTGTAGTIKAINKIVETVYTPTEEVKGE